MSTIDQLCERMQLLAAESDGLRGEQERLEEEEGPEWRALDERILALDREYDALRLEMVKAPAASLRDVARKVRFALEEGAESEDHTRLLFLLRGIERDIRAMGG